MKFRRLLAVILCFVLVLAFAACNSGGSQAPSSTTPGGTAPGGTASDAGTKDWSNGGAVPDRDYILIGYAGPMSGPMSIFMEPTPWVEKLMLDQINKTLGGIEINGKKIELRIVYADNKSDPNTAMAAAEKLVTNDKVDILIGGWTPVGTNTASAVGERYGIPTFVFGAPEESWLEGGPYEWSMGMTFNYDDMAIDMINMWNKMETNKKIGVVLDTTVDGTVGRETVSRLLQGTEYEIVDPGAFTIGTNDFTGIISKLKGENVEIVYADMITPDFALFWKQCAQYDYIPKVMTINKGMHYAADAAAMEPSGVGLTFSALWDKNYPFSSSLLNKTNTEIADMWEAEHNAFYPYSIGYDVAMYDILYDVLSRAGSLDKEAIRTAFLATDINTVFGNLKFNENRNLPVPALGTQWVEGSKFTLDKVIVASETFPSVHSYDPIIIPYTTQK